MTERESSPSTPDDNECARSTARPPQDPGAVDAAELDLAAAIRAAKAPGAARDVAPDATTKIRPFQLAEALARLSADSEPKMGEPLVTEPKVASAKTPKHVTAIATPAVEITPLDLATVGARRTAPPPARSGDTMPPSSLAAVVSDDLPSEPAPVAAAAQETVKLRRPRKPFSPLVVIAIVIGLAAIVYAYLTTNR